MNWDFHRNSLLESYKRIQLEAIAICCVSIAFTIGVMFWSWKKYKQHTSITYLHSNGVTLEIYDNTKKLKK